MSNVYVLPFLHVNLVSHGLLMFCFLDPFSLTSLSVVPLPVELFSSFMTKSSLKPQETFESSRLASMALATQVPLFIV